MDESSQEKMEEIGKIIEAMPESVDEGFLCNLFASVIWAYRFEDSFPMIMILTAQIVSKRMQDMGDGETFH